MQATDGDVVKTDFGQGGGVAFTPARVGIDLIDQLAHCVLAVTHHPAVASRRAAATSCLAHHPAGGNRGRAKNFSTKTVPYRSAVA